ncbi:transposase [Deinococcus roseus]|uniref:transposase n=1 Tax=Deinococcus roseus TaxID=392414 RepID=UPI001668AB15|nr:transposase [Deinococcus roseus]
MGRTLLANSEIIPLKQNSGKASARGVLPIHCKVPENQQNSIMKTLQPSHRARTIVFGMPPEKWSSRKSSVRPSPWRIEHEKVPLLALTTHLGDGPVGAGRFTEQQILDILQEAQKGETSVADLCRQHSIHQRAGPLLGAVLPKTGHLLQMEAKIYGHHPRPKAPQGERKAAEDGWQAANGK